MIDGHTQGIRRVAIYGRVSTQHEAQLSAFENQQAWYEKLIEDHPDWVVIDRYYDEGITGTSTQKRPAFIRMMEDASKGKFNLVVTREVCRFARNTVDTLSQTRELTKFGVAVYFVQDNIWTSDGSSLEGNDGELRLTIMATLAQEESRKTSQRVRAGQEISRKNGVLYGTGNILGYDRVDGTYIINPQQAYVVQKIFELYASGLGYKAICSELTRLGCENAQGEVSWKVERIGRILRNATYKGCIVYNKSHSDGYLTQKRINHCEKEYEHVKGDFPAIVSEGLWQQCHELRMKKSCQRRNSDGHGRKFGRKEPQSVWSNKLRCSCGSAFRKFLWHENSDGKKAYGFECYRKKREVSAKYLAANGLDYTHTCQRKSIPYWHIDLMARQVFQAVWKERKDSVLLACRMIEECATQDTKHSGAIVTGLQQQLERLRKKQKGLREMCAMGDISREEFLEDNQNIQAELSTLEARIGELSEDAPSQIGGLDLQAIRNTLDQWIDFSTTIISEALVEQFVSQVIAVDDNTYNWVMNLSPNTTSTAPPQEIARITITHQEAAQYCKLIGMKFFGKKWCDKTLIISI